MRAPLVVSFFTKDTPYEQEAIEFIASCKNFGIEHEVEGLESRGAWDRNCALKPRFILKKLKEKKRSLLWVDIDARFRKHLEPYDWAKADFSVRVNEDLPLGSSSRLCSGTLYCSYHPEILRLLEDWECLCEDYLAKTSRKIEVWDQKVLQEALIKNPSVHIVPLALKFCTICDLDSGVITQEEIIIEHTQASRRLKTAVNEELASQERIPPSISEAHNLLASLEIHFLIEVDEETIDQLENCIRALDFFSCRATISGKLEDLASLIEFSRIATLYPRLHYLCNERFQPKGNALFRLRAEQIIDAKKLFYWFFLSQWKEFLPLQFGQGGPVLMAIDQDHAKDTSCPIHPRIINDDIFGSLII